MTEQATGQRAASPISCPDLNRLPGLEVAFRSSFTNTMESGLNPLIASKIRNYAEDGSGLTRTMICFHSLSVTKR